MKITSIIKNLLLLITIISCEAKESQDHDHEHESNLVFSGRIQEKASKDSDKTSNKSPPDKTIEESLLPERKNVSCKLDSNCSSFFDYFADMAYCNETSQTCTNYCFVKIPCTTDYDCNYSIGDPKKCGVQCYKNNVNDTEGKCLIVSKEGQYCNGSYIICEGDLICDYYTNYCITRSEAQTQSGEPLFSLFLFMLIMLSLFNRQRADDDLLNNMTPNELLMVALPSRRPPQEDDVLPVYQPVGSNSNDDEILEQNLEVPPSSDGNLSTEHNYSNSTINNEGVTVEEDDLPLLPPTYDEAISGYPMESDEQPLINSNEVIDLQNNNNENSNTM